MTQALGLPVASPATDEDLAIFDARYRWCIRRELSQVRDLEYMADVRTVAEVYTEARNAVLEALRAKGFNPIAQSELAEVVRVARSLAGVLLKTATGTPRP